MTTNVSVPLPFGEPQGLVEDLVVHSLNVSVVVWRQPGQHLHGERERETKRVSVCECERQTERERGGIWQKEGGQDKAVLDFHHHFNVSNGMAWHDRVLSVRSVPRRQVSQGPTNPPPCRALCSLESQGPSTRGCRRTSSCLLQPQTLYRWVSLYMCV